MLLEVTYGEKGKRIGDNIKIIPTDNAIYDIDIHSSIDLYIADKIIQYLKNNDLDLLPELLKMINNSKKLFQLLLEQKMSLDGLEHV